MQFRQQALEESCLGQPWTNRANFAQGYTRHVQSENVWAAAGSKKYGNQSEVGTVFTLQSKKLLFVQSFHHVHPCRSHSELLLLVICHSEQWHRPQWLDKRFLRWKQTTALWEEETSIILKLCSNVEKPCVSCIQKWRMSSAMMIIHCKYNIRCAEYVSTYI